VLVILYNQRSALHSKWSEQVANEDKKKLNVERFGMNGAQSTILLVRTITDAAIAAGCGGHLVFAVGHGGTEVDTRDQALADGFVDLAPDKEGASPRNAGRGLHESLLRLSLPAQPARRELDAQTAVGQGVR